MIGAARRHTALRTPGDGTTLVNPPPATAESVREKESVL